MCEALRAKALFTVEASTPVVVNSREQLKLVEEAVAAADHTVIVNPGPLTASDDFARFLEIAPGAFIGIGAGGLTPRRTTIPGSTSMSEPSL